MSYFPFFVDVKDKAFLVVGGGGVALRKIEVLSRFDVKIIVIAADICKEIYDWKEISGRQDGENGQIELHERKFKDEDILKAEYVVAATDNEKLNTHISELCRKNSKPVNVVDVKEECSFVFPAIIKEEDLVIAVSTGGNSPAMAAKIKRDIERNIPLYYSELIGLLGAYREAVKNEITLPENRRKAYRELIRMAERKEDSLSEASVMDIIRKYR